MFGDTQLSSAAGILALLEEDNVRLNIYALERLNEMVGIYWPEISDKIDRIETLYETATFKAKDLAALLAAKVYFQLGALDDSLQFALAAGEYFDITETSEFVETIALECIDAYTTYRQKAELEEMADKCDSRMEALVERMLNKCLEDGKLAQAAGIAIEVRRFDILESAIKGNNEDQLDEMINYVSKLCLTVVEEFDLRKKILLLMVKIAKEQEKPDYINVCSCLLHLNDATMVAGILKTLIDRETQDNRLIAYQISFDIYENANQGFVNRVTSMIAPADTETQDTHHQYLSKILSGDVTIDRHLQFLIANNNADVQILQRTKDYVRTSITHNATIISNALMYAGTTSDKFLRDNLEWLAKSTNWAKFTATSSLGVIHRGHENDSRKLMSVYLPKTEGTAESATTGSPYQDGGGLYALGLIHSNHGSPEIIEYLKTELGKAKTEPAKHGALLGLGLAAMGTHDMELYEILHDQLCSDDAVVGEAAGVSIGLIMVGSNNADVLEEMIKYAQETQHEKIIRGLSLGIALMLYGQLDNAEIAIARLIKDKDPLLRRAACLGTALAYAGSGNNNAMSRLLHIAVSDVADDVRRASVQAIGFILCRKPENCPHVVELLSHSYNPHVRCGAATALGIACASTGNKEALTLLEPMVNDPVNYVRQAAVVASAMILMQHTDHTSNGKSKKYRDIYTKMIEDKHEDVMGVFGAIVAQGIIDAGGRNSSIHLADTKTGHVHMPSVVGMTCFLNSWYWFPMAHFLSLALRPDCLIMLNGDLALPELQVKSNAKASAFAYPPKLEAKKKEKKEKVETAVLSVSAKGKKAKSDAKAEEMKTDDEKSPTTSNDEKMDVEEKDGETKESETKTKKSKREASFTMLDNPSRALPMQLRLLSIAKDSKYVPVKSIQSGGIILVTNTKPDEEEKLVERVVAGGPKAGENKDVVEDVTPPPAFKWLDEYDQDEPEKPDEESKPKDSDETPQDSEKKPDDTEKKPDDEMEKEESEKPKDAEEPPKPEEKETPKPADS